VTRYTLKARKFIIHGILHADDTPHQIALGVAIATLVGLMPIMGIQTVVALALAAALRANKAVCVPVVWITNPVTFVPIYAACYALGGFLLGASGSYAEGKALVEALQQSGGLAHILTLSFWQNLLNWSLNVGVELWIGCMVVGLAMAVPAYVATRWAVAKYRHRHRRIVECHRRRRLARLERQRRKTIAAEPQTTKVASPVSTP
jgi:uncharacterized protein (DUF2062 family)